VGNVATRGGCY